MNFKAVRSSVGRVYAKPKYHAVTLVTAAVVVAFYVSLTNIPLFKQALASGYSMSAMASILLSLMTGISMAAGPAVATMLIVSAVLVGVNVSLLHYRLRMIGFSFKQSGSSFSGFVLAAAGAGCPACATGLLTLLGVTGGLAFLPFDGWELRVASFALLVLPIYWLSRDIERSACPIK